jgi:N-acetylglucosamine-6-phosphate deacetylase
MSTAKQHAIAADVVFDGDAAHEHHAVIIEGARIVTVTPRRELPATMPVDDMPHGAWLAPGFIDVQVNGGGDALFNNEPSPEGIASIAAAHRQFGTTALLPTFITDEPEKMAAAIAAVQHMVGVRPGILGIHLEGPFLSPDKMGVHDPASIRRPRDSDVEMLMSLRGGVTLVTLAPEQAPDGFVAALAKAGVRVSLGHSMATYEQTQAAMADGLTGFTHLFNAMRPLASRDPGPIAAALESPNSFYGLIVDGEHVHPAMLKLALRGAAQPMLVTDAMPPVGGRRSSFTLYGETITVRNGRCLRADGTLAGAALDMASAVRNCVRLVGQPLTRALQMASAIPAEFLGLSKNLGRLAPGFRADLVAFTPGEIDVNSTWVAGERSDSLK